MGLFEKRPDERLVDTSIDKALVYLTREQRTLNTRVSKFEQQLDNLVATVDNVAALISTQSATDAKCGDDYIVSDQPAAPSNANDLQGDIRAYPRQGYVSPGKAIPYPSSGNRYWPNDDYVLAYQLRRTLVAMQQDWLELTAKLTPTEQAFLMEHFPWPTRISLHPEVD
jgi:hypothetical protein